MKLTKKKRSVLFITIILLIVAPVFLKKEKNTFDVKEVYNTLGVDASLIKVRNSNLVYIKCNFKNAGVLHNSLKEHGISVILSSLIFRKMSGLSQFKTKEKLRKLAVNSLNAEATGDDFEISFYVLKDNIDEALQFIADSIAHPNFSENDLEYVKKIYPLVVDLETSAPNELMQDELMQMLYPKQPYGLNVTGSSDSVASITLKDVRDFSQKAFSKAAAKVFIVGDISRFNAAQYVRILLEKLENNKQVSDDFQFDNAQSTENKKIMYKKDMKDVIGVTVGIRLDNLSDIQLAGARIMVDSLFSQNGDFCNSLKNAQIVISTEANIIQRRYSSVFYIASYIWKKDLNNYMNFLRNKIKKYSTTQNLRYLKIYQDFHEKQSHIGPVDFDNINKKIQDKSLPFSSVTAKDYSEIAQLLFKLDKMKIVIIQND